MTSADRLASLVVDDRNQLEAVLMQFEKSWTPQTFARFAKPLLTHPDANYREAALSELVSIDLQRSWAIGKRRKLEAYLKSVPQLGTPDSVSPDLILSEFRARQETDPKTSIESFRKRFPSQFDRLVALAEQPGKRTAPGLTSDHASNAQASIDTSRSENTRDTRAEGWARSDAPAEKVLGRYRILQELGAGAMGTVYLAQDTQLDRQVALKTPRFVGDDTSDAIARFYREAQSAAKLQHRNICPVYDVGKIDSQHFISMAFIRGRCMTECVKPGALLTTTDAASLVQRLALGMAEAHRQNVVHRDLKPANIMIDLENEPVVMDFGLARQMDNASRITGTGIALGTPAYMSPEQVSGSGDDVGTQADVYSLGVILYELLTGELPFQGAVAQVVYQIVHTDPKPPTRLRTELDSELESICLRMMDKSRESRFQSMTDVSTALNGYLKRSNREPGHGVEDRLSDATLPTTHALLVPDAIASAVAPKAASMSAPDGFAVADVGPDVVPSSDHGATDRLPSVSVQAESRRRRPRRRRGFGIGWMATTLIGLVILGTVTIHFSDGTKLEVPSDSNVQVHVDRQGKLQSIQPDSNAGQPAVIVTGPSSDAPSSIVAEKQMGEGETQMPDWADGWGEPRYLGTLLGKSQNLASELGNDLLEIHTFSYEWTRTKGLAPGAGKGDIWRLSREPSDDSWTTKQNLGATINSPQAETGPDVSDSGLELVFNSDRRQRTDWVGVFTSHHVRHGMHPGGVRRTWVRS